MINQTSTHARARGLAALLVLTALVITAARANPPKPALSDKEQLGQFIYFDKDLSTPKGQACASCHEPFAGFTDPDHNLPVSQGVIKTRFGSRRPPTPA